MIKPDKLTLPGWGKSLSAKLLILTVIFVMIAEVLIFVPSVARFRVTYLQEKVDAGYLAGLALQATEDRLIPDDLKKLLLNTAMVRAVVLRTAGTEVLMLADEMPPDISTEINLTDTHTIPLILAAFDTLLVDEPRTLRVTGAPDMVEKILIEVLVDERPLRAAMLSYAGRIAVLSLVISLITAGLVYLALNIGLVRPMRQFTGNMIEFRDHPEDHSRVMVPNMRGDEIGIAQRELAALQGELQAMLRRKDHLATLGQAMAKVAHDLRNALAATMLNAERLTHSDRDHVREVAPRLLRSMERAVYICEQTLSYARERPVPLDLSTFTLVELIEEVDEQMSDWRAQCEPMAKNEHGETAAPPALVLDNAVPDHLVVEADFAQLYRLFDNLIRNAFDAGAGLVRVRALVVNNHIEVEVRDNGPGLPEKALKNLFVPFAGSSKGGGTGLGLAISRELARAHGGDVRLITTSPAGTAFCVSLPVKDPG